MSARKLFLNRSDAGHKLAAHLGAYRRASPVVLGLPRGGVPVAYEVARALEAPLDVCVVRKLGAPAQPELGIGAVAEDGTIYVDRDMARRVGISEKVLATMIDDKRAAMAGQAARYRAQHPPVDVRNRTVIVVDDGVATGGTARAALETLRERGAGTIVLAVPVGASETLDELAAIADEIVCLHPEDAFYAVSPWYEDFSPTTDDDVVTLLERARTERAASTQQRHDARPPRQSDRVRIAEQHDVRIPVPDRELEGRLVLPTDPRGLVIVSYGTGHGRQSPETQFMTTVFGQAGLASLVFDLLTPEEELLDAQTAHLRFDIPLLAARLLAATDWARTQPDVRALDIGYFGTSTGAAAALVAASKRADVVHAIVSRGGRPDLAEDVLDEVKAPTLLLVGGLDADVLTLNRESLYFLGCEKLLEVVPDATHLFEEPGTLDRAAHSAAKWFVDHLGTNIQHGDRLGPSSAAMASR